MQYALNLAADNRILSATFAKYAPQGAVLVDTLPEGDITDYQYTDGVYVYEPLPESEQPEAMLTADERIAELEEALAILLSGVTE